MSAAKKIFRKELDRLKKTLDKVINPGKKSMPQLVLQPYRIPPAGERPQKKFEGYDHR